MLVYGLYGETPTPVDPEIQKKVLKGHKRGETPVTGRAADYLDPELEKAREKLGDALYSTTGEQFLLSSKPSPSSQITLL